ncbi:AAA family ATPase [Jatrophihabitans sp. YIM 134969]
MGERRAVLVTGMSGTGKSSVLEVLAGRGHVTVDTDEPGWIRPVDGEPLWDLDAVAARLDRHTHGLLFVAGCVVNQGALYDRFDAVVLLSAPVAVVLERVAYRSNPFGSTPGDRERIAADLADVEPVLRAGATHEVTTTVPLTEVADALETIAGAG